MAARKRQLSAKGWISTIPTEAIDRLLFSVLPVVCVHRNSVAATGSRLHQQAHARFGAKAAVLAAVLCVVGSRRAARRGWGRRQRYLGALATAVVAGRRVPLYSTTTVMVPPACVAKQSTEIGLACRCHSLPIPPSCMAESGGYKVCVKHQGLVWISTGIAMEWVWQPSGLRSSWTDPTTPWQILPCGNPSWLGQPWAGFQPTAIRQSSTSIYRQHV